MNRNEEYRKLRQELDQTPPELEYTLTRAKAKADRHTQATDRLPAATLTALLVAFVIPVIPSPRRLAMVSCRSNDLAARWQPRPHWCHQK